MSHKSPSISSAEDSLPEIAPPTLRAVSWSAHLARACQDASAASPESAMAIVLRHLRIASGAERAFLVESERRGKPRVVVASADGSELAPPLCTSIALRALRGERPLFVADVRAEPMWADGESVRSLSIRSVLAAPLPAVDGRSLAVVLDSRLPMPLDAYDGCRLVHGFASLIGLVRRSAGDAPAQAQAPAESPVGESPSFQRLQRDIGAAAAVPLPALIVGESGSGKELVAQALHRESARRRRPFVAINCAAIPDALLERELFGAVRGAFTGADRDHPGLFRQAHGGTLFLDEIGDMPLALQAKLLRVIQERTVRAVGALDEQPIDVRLVAATHHDLAALVELRRFRADLRWRLEVLILRVPPLRERKDDLPLLCTHLIERLAVRYALPRARLAPASLDRLAAHGWPGNVRELESVLARALLRAGAGTIEPCDLELTGSGLAREPDDGAAGTKRSLERAMIEDALRASRGNMTAAAIRIGWSRQALYRKIHALGLNKLRYEPGDGGGTRSSDSSTFQ